MQQDAPPKRLSTVKKSLLSVSALALVLALAPIGPASASRLAYSIYSPYEEHNVRTGIYTVQPDGSGMARLTRGRYDFGATWSPDRSHIAFVRSHYEDGVPARFHLKVMRTDGTRRVTVSEIDQALETSRPFSWSPDSKRLAFVVEGDIYTATRRGTDAQRVTNTLEPEDDPTWSPDGTKIAFTGRTVAVDPFNPGRNEDIYVVDAAGGEPKQLTTDTGDDFEPRWSPDGAALAFISTRDHCCQSETYGSDIYLIDSDGGYELQVTEGCAYKHSHQWLPDGGRLLFTSSPDDDACPLSYRGSSMSIVNVAERTERGVLPMRWFASGGALSPSARWVAFSSSRDSDETVDLFRVRLRDGLVGRITHNKRKAHDVDPDW